MPPFGSERRYVESQPLKRLWLQLFGWRQLGPWLRYWHVERAVADLQPARVLEVGCGWGQNLFALQRQFPSAELIGVDADTQALAIARRIVEYQPTTHIRFLHAVLPALPVTGLFDLILMVDVLEYIVDDVAVLDRLRSILHPQGRFILHVPRRITEHRRYLPVSHATPGHVRPEYTREEIVNKVRAAGFEITQVRMTFGCWGTVAWECARVVERLRPLGAAVFPILLGIARLECWKEPHDGNDYLIVARV